MYVASLKTCSFSKFKKKIMGFVKLVLSLFLLLSCMSITMHKIYHCSEKASLEALNLSGYLGFEEHAIAIAAKDFGNRYKSPPLAVLHPLNVFDIAKTIERIFELGMSCGVTVAARGHGHSLHGQAQALGGVVIMMESMEEEPPIRVICDGNYGLGEDPNYYVDALGGSLWIDVLQKCLQHGLAPKSWTDYLHLTVGGTLSNAGVSGQAFRYGPQISNVKEMDIVTGTGEVLKCSEEENSDLFFGALGGLGQFGIITRARINLEPAPNMVRWIRVLYSDFSDFTRDQELLISKENTFDYIEGFVIKNRSGLLNNWRSFLYPKDPIQANLFDSEGRTLFCLEMTKNFNTNHTTNLDQEIAELLSQLRYIPSTLFQSEVTYLDFLNRVHTYAEKLKSQNLWDVPHPWLNLMVPRTKIHDFSDGVFGKIITHSNNGPIIIYPVNKSKWDNRTSAVLLDGEEIFYMVSFLSSVPSLTDHQSLQLSLNQNENILKFCEKAGIPVKQYLPHYTTQEDWKKHFGHKWEQFARRKSMYDPLAILAPGQRIFQKNIPISEYR